MTSKRYNWTPELIALLGTMPDTAIAPLVGCTHVSVYSMRVRLGIAPFKKDPTALDPEFWTEENRALLGTMPDIELAQRIGLDRSKVSWMRVNMGIRAHRAGLLDAQWTPGQIALLGKLSDQALADLLGKSRSMVCEYRHRLGIPAKHAKRPRAKSE